LLGDGLREVLDPEKRIDHGYWHATPHQKPECHLSKSQRDFHAVKDISFLWEKRRSALSGNPIRKDGYGQGHIKTAAASARISADAVEFNGQDILNKSEKEMRGIRAGESPCHAGPQVFPESGRTVAGR